MTHNAGFDYELVGNGEMVETRQVMLAQGKELKALKGLVRFQAGQIKDMAECIAEVHAQSDGLFDAAKKQAEVDRAIVDMIDKREKALLAQINGLTDRYKYHYHLQPASGFTSDPIEDKTK
jgi:hypothetical protein